MTKAPSHKTHTGQAPDIKESSPFVQGAIPAWAYANTKASSADQQSHSQAEAHTSTPYPSALYQTYSSLITIAEAASILSVSTKTIRRLIKQGEITIIRIGRSIRIHKQDLVDFLGERRS